MNFKTLIQLLDFFKDEKTCLEYLEQQRWAGNPECPFCGCGKPYVTNRGYKCRNKECHKKFTAKVGTIYENSKISLRIWFAAIYLCTANKKGISSCGLARQLGITQKTAWFVLHLVREMLKEKAPVMLKDVVEIDETYIGGKNKNRHADKKKQRSQGGAGKAPVFGAKQRGGKLVTRTLSDTKHSNTVPVILETIAPGSIMVSDEYHSQKAVGPLYYHVSVNHLQGEYVRGAFHTNGVENYWSQLKRGIYGIYHKVSTKHLERYCDEFTFRYNTRQIKDNERFDLAVSQSAGRLKHKDLIASNGQDLIMLS
jgi:transposase-like protein